MTQIESHGEYNRSTTMMPLHEEDASGAAVGGRCSSHPFLGYLLAVSRVRKTQSEGTSATTATAV